jgi:hypothetical protein
MFVNFLYYMAEFFIGTKIVPEQSTTFPAIVIGKGCEYNDVKRLCKNVPSLYNGGFETTQKHE